MRNRWPGDSREPNPLLILAGLFAAVAAFGKPPRPDHPHYWAAWAVSMIVLLVTCAICVYCVVDLVQYQLHTTPCQQMGSC